MGDKSCAHLSMIPLLVFTAALTPGTAPRLAGRGLAPRMMFGMGGGVPEVPFASAYQPRQLSALWGSLKRVYGSEGLARAAVQQNNQVMCPVYATPELIQTSHKELIALVG